MVTILLSAAFRGVALIRGRRLFQCGDPKVRRLLEEIGYLSLQLSRIFLLSTKEAVMGYSWRANGEQYLFY